MLTSLLRFDNRSHSSAVRSLGNSSNSNRVKANKPLPPPLLQPDSRLNRQLAEEVAVVVEDNSRLPQPVLRRLPDKLPPLLQRVHRRLNRLPLRHNRVAGKVRDSSSNNKGLALMPRVAAAAPHGVRSHL
jgi:hypothetical protein